MDRDDEILDTLKKILAAQEGSLEISKNLQRRAEESQARTLELSDRVASTNKALKITRYLRLAMAVIALAVLVLLVYAVHEIGQSVATIRARGAAEHPANSAK